MAHKDATIGHAGDDYGSRRPMTSAHTATISLEKNFSDLSSCLKRPASGTLNEGG